MGVLLHHTTNGFIPRVLGNEGRSGCARLTNTGCVLGEDTELVGVSGDEVAGTVLGVRDGVQVQPGPQGASARPHLDEVARDGRASVGRGRQPAEHARAVEDVSWRHGRLWRRHVWGNAI